MILCCGRTSRSFFCSISAVILVSSAMALDGPLVRTTCLTTPVDDKRRTGPAFSSAALMMHMSTSSIDITSVHANMNTAIL